MQERRANTNTEGESVSNNPSEKSYKLKVKCNQVSLSERILYDQSGLVIVTGTIDDGGLQPEIKSPWKCHARRWLIRHATHYFV